MEQNHNHSDDLKLSIAQSFITALKNDAWEDMHGILAPEVSWTLPGISLLSGPAFGADAIVKRAQSLKAFGVNFDLKHILIGLKGFTLVLHNTAQRGESLLDEQVAIVFELEQEKISSMTTYLSDVPGIDRFFIPGIID